MTDNLPVPPNHFIGGDRLAVIGPTGRLQVIQITDGAVLQEADDKGVLHDCPVLTEPKRVASPKVAFDINQASVICRRIMSGGYLSRIAGTRGAPDMGIIAYWKRVVPEFDEMLNGAYQMRGEHHAAKAADTLIEAERDGDPKIVGAASSLFAMRLRLAAHDSPARYGSRTSVSADKAGGVTVVINTGIERDEKMVSGGQIEKADDEG